MIDIEWDEGAPKNYLIYARYSSERLQNPRSIEQQKAEIEREIQRRRLPWTCIGIYSDAGVSGRLTSRPDLDRMLRDIDTGMVKPHAIITDTPERLGRAAETATLCQQLKVNFGVVVLSVTTNLVPNIGINGHAIHMAESFRAVAENQTKSHQVARGKRDLVLSRLWPGGPAPLGYRLQKSLQMRGSRVVPHSKLEPDPETAPVVVKIFEALALDGKGSTIVARQLTQDPGVPARVKPLEHTLVISIVRNPIYRGTIIFPKVKKGISQNTNVTRKVRPEAQITVDDFCAPLITDELWYQANASLDARIVAKSKTAKEDGPKPIVAGLQLQHALAGLVFCAHCGARMTVIKSGRKSKGGTTYSYYRCARQEASACQNGKYVPCEELHQATFRLLRSKLFPLDGSGAVPEWFPHLVADLEAQLQAKEAKQPMQNDLIRQALKDLEQQKSGLFQSLTKPDLAASVRGDLETKYAELQQKIQTLRQDLAASQNFSAAAREAMDPAEALKALKMLDTMLMGENATLLNVELQKHIIGIHCYSDGRVTLKGTHVGLFPGLISFCEATVKEEEVHIPAADAAYPAAPRKLSPRRLPIFDALATTVTATARTAHENYSALAGQFIWSEALAIKGRQPLTVQRAPEIKTYFTRNPNTSIAAAARHFGVTPWFIRKAMKV